MRGISTVHRQSMKARVRRLTAALAVAGLAVATASACSSGGAKTSAALAAPATPFGATASPMPSSSSTGSCNVNASSVSPSSPVSDQTDVNAIKKRGYLIVGVAADQYLTGYLAAGNVEEGFDIDLAHAIAKSLLGNANDVHFVVVSTAERVPDLQSHAVNPVDLVIDTMTITCDRLTHVDFSSVYYEAQQRLLVAKGSGYTSLSDLGGKNVCAQTGSTSIEEIQQADANPKPHAIQVTDITDCLALLEENQVSAISTDDTILAGLAEQDPNLQVVGPSLASEPYGVGMRLGATDLEAYVNGVLAQYEADGGWTASYDHWFEPSLGAGAAPRAQYSD
jgi:polar amino acid transport system substrate-binding protein